MSRNGHAMAGMSVQIFAYLYKSLHWNELLFYITSHPHPILSTEILFILLKLSIHLGRTIIQCHLSAQVVMYMNLLCALWRQNVTKLSFQGEDRIWSKRFLKTELKQKVTSDVLQIFWNSPLERNYA